MKTTLRSTVKVHMQRHNFRRMSKARPGSTLFCDTGVLWVTQARDYRDYILMPGDAMTVTNRGKVLVQAMRDADFHVA